VVVGISVAVLVLLFVTQSYDTSLVGRTLAPTVIIWLSLNAGVGIYNLAVNGGAIFASLNPWQIVNFFARNGRGGWLMLGGVVLCITGAEAMYADLGHFTRRSVSVSFKLGLSASLLTSCGSGVNNSKLHVGRVEALC
jgi:KUP system potassium uptake protein